MSSTIETSHEMGFGTARGPRPEATALRWFELLPGTQQALEELINWLYSASHPHHVAGSADPGSRVHGSEEQLATSALVSGDRGFGKTTILLSTAYALRAPGEFITPRDAGASSQAVDPRQEKRTAQLVSKLTEIRKRVVWLDPLDMEPLPTQANLLATLLVRVRNALDVGLERKRKERWAPPSLLEEGLNDPYARIDKLVRDATFMWEDIPVQGKDPRQRAEHQIKAAEIYATFRRDFREAMESVSKLLSERMFGHSSQEKVLLVLPIDNVDRSIQHLHLILKLTRMVASPQLWFVLASGRSEFQLFLERSFQMELTSSGQTPLAPKSREETLSIARRQAAAAMRRVLPPIHRIQIESVRPRGAWEFNAPAPLADGRSTARSLSYFLRKIRLPRTEEESHGLKCFADLFDIRDRLIVWGNAGEVKDTSLLEEYSRLLQAQGEYTPEDADWLFAFLKFLKLRGDERRLADYVSRWKRVLGRRKARGKDTRRLEGGVRHLEKFANGLKGKDDAWGWARDTTPPVFSYAAKLALTLSARTILDLWQAVKAAAEETERHAKNGHPLPDGTSCRGEDAPCESCEEQSIRIAETMLRASIDESDLPGWASEQLLNRIMRRNAQGRIVLDLTGRPVQRLKRTILSDVLDWGPGEEKSAHIEVLGTELHLRHFQDVLLELRDLDGSGRGVLMPPNVAGWFMLLHDMLVLTRERRVMNLVATPGDMIPELTVTLHEALLTPPGTERLDARLKFWWLLPSWNTFIDFVIFITQWKAFLHRIEKLFQGVSGTADGARALATDQFSFVMAAWIDNVCSVAGESRGGWNWKRLRAVVLGRQKALTFRGGEALSGYVRGVMGHVGELSRRAWGQRSSYHRLGIASVWLEQCLPLLLGTEFIPGPSGARFKEALEALSSEPSGHPWWERHRRPDSAVLRQRRYELFRRAVRRSIAYKAHEKAHGRGQGAESRQHRGWLSRCCEEWLELREHLGSAKDEHPRSGRLSVSQTAHRQGRVRGKGKKGSRK